MSLSKIYRIFARVFPILLLLTIVSGCKYRYIEEPEKLLSPEEMTDVLCQLAYIQTLDELGAFDNDSTLHRIGKNAFVRKVYQKYGIDGEILRKNNEYYCENNREYVKIYSEVLNRINIQAGQEEKKQQDYKTGSVQSGWGQYD